MAASDEVKMTELKRLLRRLDGLDARRNGLTPRDPATAEQREYVGVLRGARVIDDGYAEAAVAAPVSISPRSAALLAGAIAAAFSMAMMYVFMSAENWPTAPETVKPIGADRILPDVQPAATPPPEAGSTAAGDTEVIGRELVQSAAALSQKGNMDAARNLLRHAAELGYGPAALELARSYEGDPAAPQMLPQTQTRNSALARVWYERARDLGVPDSDMRGAAGSNR